ncbi:sensor histidine kinase [Dethiobacter alkaliphilus]|uniref:histidine kinase n=1 Tax=Dethiobacter alkaliphilus AHT 1 TaxID=555088 RepID=C0GF30_DETAL|nr:ATP-binding protein [Dethiobacter alkaliphilus]EEG78212.1 integral membrane sensor signal transduction histidine kinase [Dethiobacter alkaliphilus AHT 1]
MLGFYFDNRLFMLVVYAILFFVMGSAIILKTNKKSELRLARSLWLLAGYAIMHGITELIIFVHKISSVEALPVMDVTLQYAELFFKAGSFMFILWLGICLITDYFEKYSVLKIIGVVICSAWVMLAVYMLGIQGGELHWAMINNLSRYMLALPGFLMSGVGLWLQKREVAMFHVTSLVNNLRGMAITFFGAALFIGTIANEPVIWPATVLNREAFMDFFGVSVIFFRSWILIFITYFVIRIVDVFEVEREFRLEEAMRQQVLMEERERIGRELHDGIIQSIYGVGLKMEQSLLLADKRLAEAKRQLRCGRDELDNIIQDIRDYIQELQSPDFSTTSLEEGARQLVEEVKEYSMMQINLTVQGKPAADLNIIQTNNLLQSLKELLTNIAKHSRAERSEVFINFGAENIRIRISDNGVGFDPVELDGPQRGSGRQGLKNVFYRVGMMQGTVVFHAAPGQGTNFEINVPYKKARCGEGVLIKDPSYFKAKSYTGGE